VSQSIYIFSYGLGLEALGSDEDNGVPLVDEEIAGSVDILGESHCLYSSFLCCYYTIFLCSSLGHIPARFLPVVGGRLGQLTATVRIGEVVAADAAGLNLSRALLRASISAMMASRVARRVARFWRRAVVVLVILGAPGWLCIYYIKILEN
jgi:hypothetical protein